MKKVFILFLSGLLAFGAASDLCAQDFETGYFLGGNPYAFRLNPAFQSERGIFSIGLGQTGVGTWSNLGLSTLLYPSADGRGPLVNPKFSVAVSAQAKDVNACGEFVKLLLSDEIQNDLATGGTLVVNRSAFRKGAEAALSYINGDGYGNYFAGGGDPNDHRIIFSSQDIDNLEKIIMSCSGTNSVDADISIVLIEEMPAYFLGQKDLASVIKIAQDRAQKVLDERK